MASEEHEENIVRAIARVDALLSAAEDVAKRQLATVGNRAEYPYVAIIGDEVCDHIQRAREAIQGRRRSSRE